MCDTLDVVEITDTSINVEAPSETKTTPTTSTKRPLDDLDETPSADKEEHPQKKIRCSEGQPEEIAVSYFKIYNDAILFIKKIHILGG